VLTQAAVKRQPALKSNYLTTIASKCIRILVQIPYGL